MAVTVGTDPKVQYQEPTSNPGLWKAGWGVVCSNSNATAQTAGQLLAPLTAAITSEVVTLPIPIGASRFLLRQRVSASGVTVSTLAIAFAFVTDQQGMPLRVDATDQNAVGQTLPLEGTLANNLVDATYAFGDPIGPFSTYGGTTLIVLRGTASAHTGGATNAAIECLFLNG